jgi:hypothetical protein
MSSGMVARPRGVISATCRRTTGSAQAARQDRALRGGGAPGARRAALRSCGSALPAEGRRAGGSGRTHQILDGDLLETLALDHLLAVVFELVAPAALDELLAQQLFEPAGARGGQQGATGRACAVARVLQ